MNKINELTRWHTLGLATLLFLGAASLQAQQTPPQGGFDPQQMRARMMERVREQFEVTDESEWKLISERVTKVMDARRAANGGGGRGGLGFFGGPGGGPPPNAGSQGGPGGPPSGDNENGPGGAGPGGPPPQGGPGGFNREPNPELEALQTAIEAKAPSAELKAKMTELKAARAKKQADLEKAREDLRQVLSARQEAIATIMGLL